MPFALGVRGAGEVVALGGEGDDALVLRDAALADARGIVARRHADLHFVDPARLVGPDRNRTIYPFGYLAQADTLCYWEREVVELDQVLTGATTAVPSCIY